MSSAIPESLMGHGWLDELLSDLLGEWLDNKVLLESGRQGLSLIARWCRRHGITQAVLPAYHCQTMALPLWLEGMSVSFAPVGPDLQTVASALHAVVTGTDPEASNNSAQDNRSLAQPRLIVVCPTGGLPLNDQLADELTALHRTGNIIVIDATHSLLEDVLHPERIFADADVYLASLRKLLPVPDGAMLGWRSTLTDDEPGQFVDAMAERGPLDEHLVAERGSIDDHLVAERSRYLYEAARLAQMAPLPESSAQASREIPMACTSFLDALATSEDVYDQALTPVAISHESLELLGQIDLKQLAHDYARSSTQLEQELSKLEVSRQEPSNTAGLTHTPVQIINPGRACFPIVRSQLADEIDAALAQRGIFAPMYWEQPDYPTGDDPWPTDLLSIDTAPWLGRDITQIAAIIWHAAHITR